MFLMYDCLQSITARTTLNAIGIGPPVIIHNPINGFPFFGMAGCDFLGFQPNKINNLKHSIEISNNLNK